MSGYEGETTLWQGHPSWKAMLLFYVKWTLISLIPIALWVVLDVAGQNVTPTWLSTATIVLLVLTYVIGWVLRRSRRATWSPTAASRSGSASPAAASARPTSIASRT